MQLAPNNESLRLLDATETASVVGRTPAKVREYFREGVIRTTVVRGRHYTTIAEIRRAFGVDEKGYIGT
jgi:hypothetical protein